jgi:hypothetical protein
MARNREGVRGVEQIKTMKPADKKPVQQVCGTCRFMSAAEICHCYPKRALAIGAFTSNAAQPKVNPHIDWCGEWKSQSDK